MTLFIVYDVTYFDTFLFLPLWARIFKKKRKVIGICEVKNQKLTIGILELEYMYFQYTVCVCVYVFVCILGL